MRNGGGPEVTGPENYVLFSVGEFLALARNVLRRGFVSRPWLSQSCILHES
jgi:hypothetical protein